ncbi:DEAD/DEAH box helicase [Kocuria sp. SM24M-10]|uniref:DEAD/DEAH box helicase n=1 Tax=Kocuria sp. SM24M-10 TaxID=1660349 RepID=UPI0009E1A36E|nr:DEAD/DEAH box helicase [Kocuria sp. SM24M-10]
MTLAINELLASVGADAIALAAEKQSIMDRVTPWRQIEQTVKPQSLARMANLLEGQALTTTGVDQLKAFSEAFSCWKTLALETDFGKHNPDDKYLPPNLSIAFRIAVSGTASERTSEAQHTLTKLLPIARDITSATQDTDNWQFAILHDLALAVCLLVRKNNGWSDIETALALMEGLRARQTSMEDAYLDAFEAETADRKLIELVACYHLAQMVTSSGEFIQSGLPGSTAVLSRLDRHRDQALEAAALVNNGVISRLARLTNVICRHLVRNSIWNQVEGLGTNASRFANLLASRNMETPLLELWPSQQQALRKNFLDPYSRAILVQMPTSAGKTLLAKFSIVQTLALNPDSTVAYIVPTRVLVNQVVDELRRDLRGLGLEVEQAIPVFELDPTENVILSEPPSVLVTTPEKMDLLIRENHPSLKRLSQVVVDEAHNLAEGTRGARLELLLATLRRDRPEARFLLLSPFLPNATEIVEWLGDERALLPIAVDWRPNKRVVAAIETVSHGRGDYDVVLRTVDAVENSDLDKGVELPLANERKRPTSLKSLTGIAAKALREREGVTLVVCYGKSTSMVRAADIAKKLPETKATGLIDVVISHVTDELGPNNSLSPLLRKGVAYHHAGMSLETRRLIELLVHDGAIHTVAGTTTLSQGVNFPINNVIIESRTKGRGGEKLGYADFWNTAGRAGRGRLSDLGVVAFPVVTNEQRADWDSFFKEGASSIASQLAMLVQNADEISADLGFASLYNYEALSPFMQYLAHAMKVSGATAAVRDIEDLLRGSLVYRQAQDVSEETASQLVRLCRAYLQDISRTPGLVALADGTGFSTPSVNRLRYDAQNTPSLRDYDSWNSSLLFGSNADPLATRIDLLASLPEMRLGRDDPGQFSSTRVARIISDWVNGRSVPEMVAEYGNTNKPEESRFSEFTAYLYSSLTGKVSWGMGALQRVSWAGNHSVVQGDSIHIPSMIFYGVNSKEAVWMRMAGLPRDAASRAAELWKLRRPHEVPVSYGDLRSFVGGINADDWEATRGSSVMSGDQMVSLWSSIS